MNPQAIIKTIDLGDNRPITIETGKLAKQADGSVVVRQGDTMLLAAVVSSQQAKEGLDFLPLTVEYREKFAATGRFPGGYFKREARPYDDEILVARLIDRALRPMFPDDFHAETQVIVNLISADKDNMPDSLAGLAASAALAVSDIPFNGPISEVRVARVEGKFVINPTWHQLSICDLELMVAGSADSIIMVEGEMKEVSEAEMLEALELAHSAIKVQCKIQNELAALVPKSQTKRTYDHEPKDEELKKLVWDECYTKYYDAVKKPSEKKERSDAFAQIEEDFKSRYTDEEKAEKAFLLKKYTHDCLKDAMRNMILNDGLRLDGRDTTTIRPIWSEVGTLPGPHGSSVFTRGETQSLTTVTLGTKLDQQTIDGAVQERSDRFLLHYNFPPFSTGEARPMRGTSRREIGHGNLALRALKPVLPGPDKCPYTIRVVSDILESNGSSSMATVCAGTLALMDAGVGISAPVSGIAMGLITDESNGKYAVLSDILGDEDHLGDMDFKVTGTSKGITACQMDIKVKGLSMQVMREALEQARMGRLHILGEIVKTMDKPREDYKPHAPRMISFEVPTDVIGAIIGPGGKIIQEIQKTTNTVITIEEVGGKGYVEISSADKAGLDAGVKRVRDIAFPRVIEIGEVYEGAVKTIQPFGAFVEIVPGQDGLIHVSELEWRRIQDVREVLNVGDLVKFKVIGRDPKNGKLKLSRKALLPRPEGAPEEQN
ncbi:MAG: polyribonucleotide nucleotidyltransferase [Flavobacteriales bacterium]|nr:polyribonucleotide nucleotidyltransferase [Flavobacteriales bacterium]